MNTALPSKHHYVDPAPFDPGKTEPVGAESESFYRASSWQLMWWKFRRHKVALAAAFVLLAFYLLVPFVEIVAPYNQTKRHGDFLYAPPQAVHLMHEGRFVGPFTYPYTYSFDLESFRRVYTPDRTKPQPIRFLCQGNTYQFWGMWEMSFHLVCPPKDGTMFLLGTDRLGRDLLSRIIYGARISLTIGIVGIAVSFALGLFFGGLAGYLGGWVDHVIQRMIEILRSLPELPLWLALSAALPANWSPILVFFGITIILGLLDWPGLARAVRSKLLSLREEDFVKAAELMGASKQRIIARHLIPNFMSHLIASATLSIPSMILGETALSFLGLGLRPPVTSWGVLLNEAQNLAAVQLHPWLLFPMVPVVIVVLAFNFMGDGLRDAADPYH
ncbi:ABC transporter permease [Microvirga lotononidis]|uniref:ABC-type dipeptide/oligopeptide/nickel transport system, permease component n=1 Tax=Microvirga lotononidis TaxID=864069 RepID=I4YNL8_9HYPH|nr:ABC transporter permease [Microvirga lotononidis]EIM25560.1 ABC-type dipeptide/oligopeptide/nickel transport system, permease component [Microvirga lotononidis]WQO26132.1 ABC transporter permease [Microvirga lotononidis]